MKNRFLIFRSIYPVTFRKRQLICDSVSIRSVCRRTILSFPRRKTCVEGQTSWPRSRNGIEVTVVNSGTRTTGHGLLDSLEDGPRQPSINKPYILITTVEIFIRCRIATINEHQSLSLITQTSTSISLKLWCEPL